MIAGTSSSAPLAGTPEDVAEEHTLSRAVAGRERPGQLGEGTGDGHCPMQVAATVVVDVITDRRHAGTARDTLRE